MFYDRLKKACKKANTTVTATLKAIGIGTANGTYWKNGSAPSSDVVVKLSEFLGVSTDYLLIGKDNTEIDIPSDVIDLISAYNSVDIIAKAMIKERALTLAELATKQKTKDQKTEQTQKAIKNLPLAADEQPDPNEQEPEEDDGYYIDFYDFPASAGTGLLIDDTVAEKLMIKNSPEALSADYAIPISGDSMEPSFSSGDTVLIKSCQKISEGQIGIFVLDGDVYIKEYGGNCLISHNTEYSPIMLKGYRVAVCLGRVLGKAEVID